MPLIYFSRISENRKEIFFAEMPRRRSQGEAAASTSIEGEASCSVEGNFKLNYEKLPDRLKSCLDYCSLITFTRYSVDKDKIIRLILAEGLVSEIPGEAMEKVAEMIIDDLVGLGMLVQDIWSSQRLEIDGNYRKVCLVEVKENEFLAQAAESPVRAVIDDDGTDIPPNFKTLQIRSLFLTTLGRRVKDSKEGLSGAYMESICKIQSLAVLDLNGQIECLPDGIGNLVNLRYLGLFYSGVDELPPTFSNLQKLQSLDIRCCRLGNSHELPVEVLSIKQLRHLLMGYINCEIKVPKGFGAMKNLHTCDGVYGGGGIANELGNLIQLRELVVKRVADDHAYELAASIMKMTNLVSLSLEAEGHNRVDSLLPEMEQFCPPPLLQELRLIGGLAEIPDWLENLTTLYLSYSRLLVYQTSVLQLLPELKHLRLSNASEAKCMGKEFCEAGGFPKLETLEIQSRTLVEWTEIVEGAFPNLRSLSFFQCLELKFLPEGLQYILTLERLIIHHDYNDIARRLEGEENYKIKHIKNVILYYCTYSGKGLKIFSPYKGFIPQK